MKFYYVNADVDADRFTATLDEARKLAREAAKGSYNDVMVHQVEVATDRANILRLLNVAPGTQETLDVVYTAKAKLKTSSNRKLSEGVARAIASGAPGEDQSEGDLDSERDA